MSERVQWRMPAEWEPHDGCLMAWPTRSEWGRLVDEARSEYAGVANAIAAFEPVHMVCAPGDSAAARAALAGGVEIVELPFDHSWLRDSGPIFVVGDDGERAGVHFRFNSWGERFLPYDQDGIVAQRILERLGISRRSSSIVLEGGSIAVDGEGTLITTEQCLLNPNRNPDLTREDIEAELRAQLGLKTILWLPYGHADDEHTDGHVDGVCAFVRPGAVIVQACEDPAHPDYDRMRANRAVLERARLQIVELPLYPFFEVDRAATMVSYVNFYVANGGIVVPLADTPHDEEALTILRAAFPDREVVGARARVIAHGGGGVHCITQQIPRAAG